MKLVLCFKDIKLGVLTCDEGKFFYDSIDEGEKQFSQFLSSKAYKLFGSKKLEQNQLFEPFSSMVKKIRERSDLMQKCKVDKNVDDFGLLWAYAHLKQDKFGYNLLID